MAEATIINQTAQIAQATQTAQIAQATQTVEDNNTTFNLYPIIEKLICPLSNKIFKNPVLANDGGVYENRAIVKYMKDNDFKSPLKDINKDIKIDNLIPLYKIKSYVLELLEKIPSLQQYVYDSDEEIIDIYNFNKQLIKNYIDSSNNKELLKLKDYDFRDIMKYTRISTLISQLDTKTVAHIMENGGFDFTKINDDWHHHVDNRDYNMYLQNGWGLINIVATGYADNDKFMEYILSKGADVNRKCKKDNWTPLHQAVNAEANKNVKLLVENGADMFIINRDGNLPLKHLDGCNNDTVVYCLTKLGKDGVELYLNNKYFRSNNMKNHIKNIYGNVFDI